MKIHKEKSFGGFHQIVYSGQPAVIRAILENIFIFLAANSKIKISCVSQLYNVNFREREDYLEFSNNK